MLTDIQIEEGHRYIRCNKKEIKQVITAATIASNQNSEPVFVHVEKTSISLLLLLIIVTTTWIQFSWWAGILAFFIGAFLVDHFFPFSYRVIVASNENNYFIKYGTVKKTHIRKRAYMGVIHSNNLELG